MRFANIFPRLIKPLRNLFPIGTKTVPPSQLVSYQPSREDLLEIKETLERILNNNIIPFWHPQVIDLIEGGYRLNHDFQGNWKGRSNKYLVSQARTVWFFSRVSQTEYGSIEHLNTALHGYEFLCDRMWDKQFGGFYWEVDSSGNMANKSNKQSYGQAFGLYALSEYAIASRDSRAIAFARELFRHLESHAHDVRYGGYQEFFLRDWNPVPPNIKSYIDSVSTIKLMNTHLHLLEAIMTYYAVTKDQIAWERLIELILILSNAVVRKTIGTCSDKYQLDWTPLDGTDYNYTSYGHDVENIWLLIEACNIARIPHGPLLDLYRTLFNYSKQHGFDKKEGGFYYLGPSNESATRREKIWWVQAEGLVSALQMYLLTKEEFYFNCFSKTLDWIVKYQVDWEEGEWFAQVDHDGKPSGDKAGEWKTPYHNGRSIIKCLEIISSLIEL
jgi:cellobiose epimerase